MSSTLCWEPVNSLKKDLPSELKLALQKKEGGTVDKIMGGGAKFRYYIVDGYNGYVVGGSNSIEKVNEFLSNKLLDTEDCLLIDSLEGKLIDGENSTEIEELE